MPKEMHSQIIRCELHVDSTRPISRQEAADLLAKYVKNLRMTLNGGHSIDTAEVVGGVVVHVSGANAGSF